ncbi:hypothetical protein GCM10007073_04090 [Micrococcus flavus]|nr:hypothetical protein GCM10007073_04090 [Micrococcus flavus]
MGAFVAVGVFAQTEDGESLGCDALLVCDSDMLFLRCGRVQVRASPRSSTAVLRAVAAAVSRTDAAAIMMRMLPVIVPVSAKAAVPSWVARVSAA